MPFLPLPAPHMMGGGVTNANGQTSIETRHRTENIHHFKERVVGGDDSFSFTHFVSTALLLEDYYLPMSVSERPHGDAVGGTAHTELLLTETIFRTLQAVIVHFHSQRLSPSGDLREQRKQCLPCEANVLRDHRG